MIKVHLETLFWDVKYGRKKKDRPRYLVEVCEALKEKNALPVGTHIPSNSCNQTVGQFPPQGASSHCSSHMNLMYMGTINKQGAGKF